MSFVSRVPITSSNPNGGTPVGRVIRARGNQALADVYGSSAAIVNITEGTFPISDHPTPGGYTDIKYDANLGIIVAPANGAFTPDESVIFEPDSMIVWGQVYQSTLLVHDPKINPRNGVFIEPIYLEEAQTPWDAFNIVAKKLAEGADIDAIHCYAIGTTLDRDAELAILRGRPVKFNSDFLNIQDGKALELSRASTFRLQRLKGDVSGKPPQFTTDLSIAGVPSFTYILTEVYTNVRIEYLHTLPEQGPELQNPTPTDVAEYMWEVNRFRYTTPTKYIIPIDELISRIYQVRVHLELIRDAYLINAPLPPKDARHRIVIENLLQEVKDEYAEAWAGTIAGFPTSLKIWHDIDNQGISVFDEKQLALTDREVALIDRIDDLFGPSRRRFIILHCSVRY